MSAFSLESMPQRRAPSSETGASARRIVGSGAEDYAVGRVLAGRYRIERLIGMGAMGVVLEARHLELETRVAIKAILPEMQSMPGVLSLFAREAKAAVAIRSEHVAQVFDVGTDDDLGPYIVMEYLEGRDLRAVLELDRRIPLQRAIDYILQACEAVASAHAKGVIHRDIKPENLFLTRQGDLEIVKLLDFGVSKAAITRRLIGGDPSARETTGFMGTPLYMSPEQIRSSAQVDHRADIWSLGAVLYELVSGHSAFSSKDGMPALLHSICVAAPPPLAAYCSGPEVRVQGVIDQCLDKNPARRFQNVAELAYALFPFASSRSRLHAQRAASILGTRAAAEAAPTSAKQAPLSPRQSAQIRFAFWRVRRLRLSSIRTARRCLLVGALVVGSLLLGQPRMPSPGQRAEWLELFSKVMDAGRSAFAPDEVARPPLSRSVQIESQPSGAVVSIDGQVVGVTPLSTLLPSGAVRLSLSKVVPSEAQQALHTDVAAPLAPPLSVRVAQRRAATERTAKSLALEKRVESALLAKPRLAQRAKSQPSPTPRGEPSSPSNVSPSKRASAPSSSEPRLRLVEDPPPPSWR